MKEKIIEVLAKVLEQNIEVIREDAVIRDLPGFDSLHYVMMISELDESYNIEIPLEKALEVETVGELIACAKIKD